MPNNLLTKIKQAPTAPGVYKFLGKQEKVLYVGKAKNIRKRIAQYFTGSRQDDKVRALIKQAQDLDFTIVHSEHEALILEQQLIKHHHPRYNVQLRDDKQYAYLCITVNDLYPSIVVTRNTSNRNARYLGPFPSVPQLRATLKYLRKKLQFRQCGVQLFSRCAKTMRPCLDHHVHLCSAPCVGAIAREQYQSSIETLIAILQGKRKSYRQALEKLMVTAAKAEQYEDAARLRDQLFALDQSAQQQSIVLATPLNADVVGFAHQESFVAGAWWRVREGAVQDVLHAIVELPIAGDVEAAELQVLQALCPRNGQAAPLVLERDYTQDVLGVWFGEKEVPSLASIGVKKSCVQVLQLAKDDAQKEVVVVCKTQPAGEPLVLLQEALNLPHYLQRIECYDISHLGGTGTVASMVVFLDGKSAKQHYRLFTLTDNPASDDYEAMAVALTRRIEAQQSHDTDMSFSSFPSLIMVDGGKGQLERAQSILSAAGDPWSTIPLISLAKREEEIFLSGKKVPLSLSRKHASSLLLQRIRDEAHRFAISCQRKKRKVSLHSSLETIPGIGPKTIQLLRISFGSIKDIQQDDFPKLVKVIGKKRATVVFEYLLSTFKDENL